MNEKPVIIVTGKVPNIGINSLATRSGTLGLLSFFVVVTLME